MFVGQRIGVLAGFFQRVAMQHHLGTKAACALHLYAGRKTRHHDHGAQSQPLRVVGHALRMVARAHGHHAVRALFGREQRELVAGPALLERGGELQVFEFEEHLRAHDLRERAGLDAGGVQHLAL